jgi:hypothetical protein
VGKVVSDRERAQVIGPPRDRHPRSPSKTWIFDMDISSTFRRASRGERAGCDRAADGRRARHHRQAATYRELLADTRKRLICARSRGRGAGAPWAWPRKGRCDRCLGCRSSQRQIASHASSSGYVGRSSVGRWPAESGSGARQRHLPNANPSPAPCVLPRSAGEQRWEVSCQPAYHILEHPSCKGTSGPPGATSSRLKWIRKIVHPWLFDHGPDSARKGWVTGAHHPFRAESGPFLALLPTVYPHS